MLGFMGRGDVSVGGIEGGGSGSGKLFLRFWGFVYLFLFINVYID